MLTNSISRNYCSSDTISFRNYGVGLASYLEENVLLNKALVDASIDIPFICLANNKTERKERIRRIAVNYPLCFISPLVTLPLTNRLAMRYIAKLIPKFNAKEANLIHISNKFLKDKDSLKEGIELLSKEKETDYSKIIEKCGGDYEKIRRKLINAKNAVLSFDFLFSAGSVSGMAFLNNRLTKNETNRNGYSAEFELADKETVERRAEKYKKSEPLRKGVVTTAVGLLTALPLLVRNSLLSDKTTGIFGVIKKHADKFDYTNGIFMKRLPLFLFMTEAYGGIALASRNKTELKNNLIMGASSAVVFFGGDLVINSILSNLSDKYLHTNIIDRNAPKTFLNKIIAPTKPIKELQGKSKNVAAINFFINLALLAYFYGYGTPKLMNKIIRKDLKKDAERQKLVSGDTNYA